MKSYLMTGAIFAAALITGALSAPAQTSAKAHVEIPVLAANPADVGTIEDIVRSSYETISGGVGVPRQWGRDRTLYDPNVRFVGVGMNSKTGVVEAAPSLSEQEYADESDGFMVKEGFTERELAHEIHRYGNVATVLSSYEGKLASTGKVVTRGVNIFQLYYDGKRWWILSMVWDEERPENPIPPQLQLKP